MSKFTVIAQLYTLREYLKTNEDVFQTFKSVKSMGYNAVQVSGTAVDPVVIREAADKEGLKICVTHIPFNTLSTDMEMVIKQHKLYGCKYVGIGSMPNEYRVSKEGYIKFAKEASEYGRILRDNGLQLIYHNHNFEFTKFDGILGMDILFQETDPDAVHFEIDSYWVQAGGCDPVEWIKKMAGRMAVVHFKDMAIDASGKQLMAEVGEGNLNWKAIIEACNEIGAEWCAVEQDVCYRNPFESLEISLKNLKDMGCSF
jgi:sugar phosphate isomerase/epimerase